MPHTDFAQALVRPDRPCPQGLVAWNGSDPAVRFAVYRNNVMVSLLDALAATFDVTQALVGEDFFRDMARAFLRNQTARPRVLTWLGLPFPEFIAQFEAAASVPYLADVARLEMARVCSTHATDHDALEAEQWAGWMAEPARLAQATFTLAPCVRLLQSPWAMVSIWAAHQVPEHSTIDLQNVDISQAESALVFRKGEGVWVQALDAATYAFLHALQQGQPLMGAVQNASDVSASFEVSAALALLIQQGLVADVT